MAQAPEAPRAEQLFYEGVRALHEHAYEQARTLFEQSLAIAPRGSVLLDLAKAEWALGRHVDALKHLRAALDRSDLPPDNREPAARGLARWSAAVGHLAVNTEAGAQVLIDGTPVEGSAPFADPIDVEPGVRAVEARLGGRSARVEVDAKAGVVVEANAPLAATSSAAAPASTVAGVYAPPSAVLPGGSAPDRQSAAPEFWSPRRIVGASVAGVGVASLMLGGVFFALASSDEHRATAAVAGLGPSGCSGALPAPACAAQDTALASERTDGTISRVAIGAGIAAVAVGAVVAMWPSASTRTVAIAPTVNANGVSLALGGRF